MRLRIAVLKRDGTGVVTNTNCAAVSGNWVSPYDGVPTTLASDLDIVCLPLSTQLVLTTKSLGSCSSLEGSLDQRSP